MPRFCEQCGAPLTAGTRFCEQCGAPVPNDPATEVASAPAAQAAPAPAPAQAAPAAAAPARCPQCGTALEPGFAFCMECGAPVAGASAQAAPAPAAAALFCDQCGAALSAGQRACHVCGAPVMAAGAAAGPGVSSGFDPGAAQAVQQGFAPEKKQGFFSRLFKRKQQEPAPAQVSYTETPPQPSWTPPAQQTPQTGGYSFCPQCGAPVKPWMRMCQSCGAALDDGAVAGTTGGNTKTGDTVGPWSWDNAPAQDDTPTTVFGPEGDDYPTTLVDEGAAVYIVRASTGDRIDMVLPAVLGKGSAATCLIAGNTAISRQHARIVLDGQDYVIEDLETTNGTIVDGYRLERGGSAVLGNGSIFALANEEFTFYAE